VDISERHRRGSHAEQIVAAFVGRQGMTVICRNMRVGYLELDLVALDGDSVVVIEVRSRNAGSWVAAFRSLDVSKRRRLRRAATIMWLRKWSRIRGIERVRFDAAAVHLDGVSPEVVYVRAAF
jgi:putative endonuclease